MPRGSQSSFQYFRILFRDNETTLSYSAPGDHFHLVQDVIDRLPHLDAKGSYLKQMMQDKLIEHNLY